MLGGEYWRFGARWVLSTRGHQLDRSDVFVGQLPQTSLSVLDHLLHRCVLLKRFIYLPLTDENKDVQMHLQTFDSLALCKKTNCAGPVDEGWWQLHTPEPELQGQMSWWTASPPGRSRWPSKQSAPLPWTGTSPQVDWPACRLLHHTRSGPKVGQDTAKLRSSVVSEGMETNYSGVGQILWAKD